MEVIEIPFGAKDSELQEWTYTIPKGMKAEIRDGKVIIKKKESEDERMIGVIRLALTDVPEERFTTEGTSLSKVLAWIEKQKYDRMKPIYDARESFESALEKAWNDYHNGYENVDKLEDDYVECAHAKGFREGYLFGIEKQKEQKPILEVFGFKVGDAVRLKDGDGRKHIIKSFEGVEGIHGPNFYRVEFEDNSARDGIYPGEEYPNGYYTQMEKFEEEQKPVEFDEYKIIKKHITEDMLSSEVNKRLTECGWYVTDEKPVEWSEEDEKHINLILRVLNAQQCWDGATGKKFNPYQREIDWLKSLHPQPKQEWSEEDKHRRSDAIYFLETAKKHYADTSEIELTIKWLKSLQPQAKKEQKPVEWSEKPKHTEVWVEGRTIFEQDAKDYTENWMDSKIKRNNI